ncbi:MAG: 30S ribosomal protein S17 [SAR324 cluster bacterium]|nr:30S ribosomal protein S17 [SAR324 cluster bacterium]
MNRKNKKARTGIVVSDKMDKSIVVKVERIVKHPLYKKTIRRSKKYMAHDESNKCKIGDTVQIIECKPLSSRKTWRLLEVVATA